MSEVAEKVVVRSLRELDAIVAEQVMDYRLNEYRGLRVWEPPDFDVAKANQLPCILNPDKASFFPALPRFSESIADAWQVLERLEQDGWTWEVAKPIADVRQCFLSKSGHEGVGGYHQFAPIAICLAVLKTQGVEVSLELDDAT